MDIRPRSRHAESRGRKGTNAPEGIWQLPLAEYPLFNLHESSPDGSLEILAPTFWTGSRIRTTTTYWKRWAIEEHYPDITVPALHVAAWYDIFQGGSVRNYEGIKAHGGSDAAKRGQHLLVMIGGHAGGGRKIGDIDFGPAAAELDENDFTIDVV